jgi:hypothetical protein
MDADLSTWEEMLPPLTEKKPMPLIQQASA